LEKSTHLHDAGRKGHQTAHHDKDQRHREWLPHDSVYSLN
jgi:hypothetical protein